MKSFDLVVIGGGPGGYPAAIRAAQRDLKVVLIEKGDLGGACLSRGCIPSKGYIAAAEAVLNAQLAEKIGVSFSSPRIDYAKIVLGKNDKVKKLAAGIAGLLKGNGVEWVQGEATLESVTRVKVGGETLETRNILLATGSEPVRPAAFPFDGETVLTTDEIFKLNALPKQLLVIGGGVIGCELASAYNLLGSQVTVVEFLPEILPQEGGTASKTLRKILEKRGIVIKTGTKVEALKKGAPVVATLAGGEKIEVDVVLVSIGRRLGEDRLGLSKLGIQMNNGFVEVNDKMQTSVPSIYAVGDLVGTTLLAHGATAEGIAATENISGNEKKVDYKSIPRVTYTIPEIASVGKKESELKAAGVKYETGRFSYMANGMAMLHEETEGQAEIYVGDYGEILGACVIGVQASNLIQEVSLCMRNDLPVESLIETVHAHPTIMEIIHEAAEDAQGLAIHKLGRKRSV